ncbi:pseudouridine-5'-phosphate glycosidase [Helicovermis profundi]|uniref:Pseudouridine-5'-phosphate glycosidase n=1 Tax=Helicovermis profundi TaxID=3065157 RepID=A0AAU9E8Y4_9FIRM|nr:pseudouridine-5'-phosphate glycosidase [Clostridia bacterium S502]
MNKELLKEYLDINPEVEKALKEGRPVVALESTIIAHGMPYPKNVETARKVEDIIRAKGAVPATIGIIKGRLKAGLTDEEIEYMGKEKDIKKVSRRDIPFIVSNKLDGATTVASTMIISELAGIKVFVTGGIGGVHRGGENTFDISADLQELSNTNVAVVCAGAKSILDINLTLEYLETYGVTVVGYKTDEFPAFYTRKSGFGVDYKVDSALEIAKALKAKWDLGLEGGMVIGNPIPKEFEMDYDTISGAIEKALIELKENNIKGKETTPFLLAKVKELTSGDSLDSNIELVYNNARVGTDIAIEYASLK